MDLKYSYKADAVANLYRSALYLAKGDEQTASDFLTKAYIYIDKKNSEIVNKINNKLSLKEKKILAEKILDEYQKLKFSLI